MNIEANKQKNMQLRRYTVDLQAYMSECETNYRRLCRLLPEQRDFMRYRVALPGEQSLLISFTVAERCRYTTIITIRQSGIGGWLAESHFEVRLYHDARMAEVFAFQKRGRVYPVYDYPNEKMHQKDEKFQQQRFLSECLLNCLKNGFSESVIPVL